MESLNWKPFLVVASAALTAMGSTASAQIASSPIQQVKASNADDGNLFDSRLVAQNANCSPLGGPCVPNAPGMPAYPPTTAPGTTPLPPETPASPQPITPDNVFNNQQNNNLANNDTMPNLNALGAGQGALTAQSSIASMMVGGYLDPAAPMTTFRLRYDNANNNLYPDRGEYIYAKCGCFRSAALAGPLQDPSARGPQGVEQSISFQEIRPYFELAFNNRLSVFAEVPVRFIDFHSNPVPDPTQQGLGNENGLGDVNAGFKYALIADPNRYVTFQLRTYVPTGDSYRGLGTGHVSIEPSLLFYQRLSEKWIFQGQLTEWTPINVSSYASQVLQYGGGFGYILYQGQNTQVTPLLETVGWTFIGGQKFNAFDGGLQSASGDTIVNVKPGVRIGWGGNSGYMTQPNQSLYVGFGIPVTDQEFYNNLFRAEYRIIF